MADKSVKVRLEALTAQYTAAMAKATASTQVFGETAAKNAKKNKASFTQLGMAGLAFGGALAFGLGAAANAAIDFESSFAGVRKTVEGTEPQLQAISDGLREMALEIPVNVNELNRIAEAAGQLGISRSGILSFTETIAKLGVTTNIVGEDAAASLARIANIMGTSEKDFERLGSTIVELGNKGASTEAEIVEMALRIAGAGKTIGLSEADVLAFGNALSSVGVRAEAGGSAISKVFIDIASAVADGGEKLDLFAEVAGVSSEKFAKAFEKDAAGAMLTFIDGLGAIDKAGGNVFGVLDKLSLSEIRTRDALLRAASAGDLFRQSVEDGSDAWRENTALQEEAQKRFDTTASKIQLAKNEINDAAISFGAILLPAIAAVMGTLGEFAHMIGDLPGPLKTVAVILTAAAAALGILGGAALILVPRIAATQLAMKQLTGSTKLFQGTAVLAAKAFNPWSIGITAVTVGLGFMIAAHAKAKQRVDDLTASIEADSGALGENTRELVANRLEEEGALEAAQRFGLELDTVVDAALGNADAIGTVYDAIAEPQRNLITSSDRVKASVIGVTQETKLAMEAAARKEVAVEGEASADETAAGAAGKHDEALAALGDTEEEVASLTDQLTDAFELLAGVQLTAREAAINYQQSLTDTFKELKSGTKTLDIHTQAGRDNASAILDSVHAAIDHGAAVAEESGSLEKGIRVTSEHIRALRDEAIKAGISKDAIDDYIRSLNLTPKQIKTLIELRGKDKAQHEIDSFIRSNSGKVIGIRFEATGLVATGGGHQTPHAGGVVGASGARRMHGGGKVRSDEELIIAQRGEHVLTARQYAALRSPSPTVAMRETGPSPVFVGVRLDRRRFTRELDHDATYSGSWD